jgi:hypothetical protein
LDCLSLWKIVAEVVPASISAGRAWDKFDYDV